MKLGAVLLALASAQAQVPTTWEQTEVDTLELPAALPAYSAIHIDQHGYYGIPSRVIYRDYAVYAPDREPADYQEWLKSREPEVAFDSSKIHSADEWVKAGELVFNAPTSFSAVFFSADNLRDPEFYSKTGMPIAADGTVPFARWVIRRKGVVELGSMGCNTCHTRVLPDGSVAPGAQGNNPGDRQGALLLAAAAKILGEEKTLERVRTFARQFQMPWLPEDMNRVTETFTLADFVTAGQQIPAGTTARANTSMLLPPQIPDLIGVRERRFLDHTGLVRHRNIGDLMRYSSLAQDLFSQDRYASVPPRAAAPPARYSDEQLYALALYLYSLRPPNNPHRFDAPAKRGKSIFARERCGTCHTPPFYTNNRLIPVDGFVYSTEAADIIPIRIGVDPRYTLETHKSTGYYKVPSLKGVWYRGPFGHNGSAASLEDWFDPSRLKPNYVPTGFKGYDGRARSIPGHLFGLTLSLSEREDLLVFLNTL
jgi:mono/diheme cytochrome c family protein